MQQHGSKYLVILELKPEAAHDPHCFQMTEVTNIQNAAIIRALDNTNSV